MKSEETERIPYFDFLNVVSCICVVCMHSNGYIHTFNKDEWWWLRVLIEVICYFAVPVFFMLSGATLLNYQNRYSDLIFLKKRFKKTVIPFLIWGIIFYSLYLFGKYTTEIDWKTVFYNFSLGKIPFTNYWFFIPLFVLYLFIPFLARMIENISQRQMGCLLLMLLFFQSFLPTLFAVLGLEFKMSLPIGGYALYAIAGYYFAKFDIKGKWILWSLAIAAIVSMVVRYYLVFSADGKIHALFTYFGLFAVFPSFFLFLFAKFNRRLNNNVKLLRWVAGKTFGVYLLHTFIIRLLERIINRDAPYFILISFITAFCLSLIIVAILQKNAFTKKLVP